MADLTDFLECFHYNFYSFSWLLEKICWEEVVEVIFFSYGDVWPGVWTEVSRLISQHTTYYATATLPFRDAKFMSCYKQIWNWNNRQALFFIVTVALTKAMFKTFIIYIHYLHFVIIYIHSYTIGHYKPWVRITA